MKDNVSKPGWKTGLGVVLLVGLLQRVALYLLYPPVGYSDSGAYRRLAQTILDGWYHYDGTRPPGYPVFMALVGGDAAIYLTQLTLGLLTTLLFFWLGWRLSGSWRFGMVAGLAHTLNPGQLFFEANLLSESLATFLLALLLVCICLALESNSTHRWGLWLALGALAGLAGLVRSLFLFMPAWVVLFLAFFSRGWRRRLAMALAVLLPAVIFIGSWINFMNTRYGILGITTMTGFHMVQHTGDYFEFVPDQDAALRDTFLKYRNERMAQTGTSANAIWDAIPEMMRVSDLDFHGLSNRLAQLSTQLILQHPDRYLANVIEGWWMFWRAPVYWKPGAFVTLQQGLEAFVLVERSLLFGANLLFVFSSLLAVFWQRWRTALRLSPAWIFIASTIWLSSILQTLPDHGDNPRFLVPLQTWVVLWVLMLAERWIGIWKASRLKSKVT